MGEIRGESDTRSRVAALHARLRPRLERYFAKRNVPAQERDDLLQETFQRLLEELIRRVIPRERVEPWVFATARNIAADFFRHAGRACALAHEIPVGSAQTAEMLELSDLVHRAIGELPPKLHDVFVVRHLDELENHEISARLGVSPGTVATRLHRARTTLVGTLERTFLGTPRQSDSDL